MRLYRWHKEYESESLLSFLGNEIQALSDEAKELVDLKKKFQEAETERDILKSFELHLQERSLIFQFIRDYNSGSLTIEVMCKVLKVSRSSYYVWLKAPKGARVRSIKSLMRRFEPAISELKVAIAVSG